MRFQICIKQVPDVSASVDTGRMVLNAYDASAVEEALVLRDQFGGHINLLLVGPQSAAETIRKALAMGADSATHLVYEASSDLDSGAISEILAAELSGAEYDVVLCGKQAQDTDAGLTGGMLAERLGLPYTTNAVGLEIDGGQIVVTRQGDSGRETILLPTPCLVTCSNDMNDPRIPSLKGIMASKKKPISSRPVESAPDNATTMVGFVEPPQRPAVTMIDGTDEAEAVERLVRELKKTSKVLQ